MFPFLWAEFSLNTMKRKIRRISESTGSTIIGNAEPTSERINDILFVVYTERIRTEKNGEATEITRLISARLATNFERGLYYGKYD